MNSAARAAMILLALALTACPPPGFTIAVKPGSTREHLEFEFKSEDRALALFSDLRVRPCTTKPGSAADDVMVLWHIRHPPSEVVGPVRYGQAPNGFAVLSAPMPLQPGCYILDTSGYASRAQRARFRVNADGTVMDDP
jgi:hypothetical protein